jgi:hypothetical protein
MDFSSSIDGILRTLSKVTPNSEQSYISEATTNDSRYDAASRASQNVLDTLPPSVSAQVKSLLVTLHFFFPHDFLPALDLIDRRLLTCLQYWPTITSSTASAGPRIQSRNGEVWYVQSASAVTEKSHRRGRGTQGRFRNAMRATNTHYEVRLDSWNCSCAAFAFSAFQLLSSAAAKAEDGGGQQEGEIRKEIAGRDGEDWAFGGTATDVSQGIPICKHVVAAILTKAAPELFGNAVAMKIATREDIAGWGVGWGDAG